jgi:predicted DCC family thiol-disulfide oxidoreductase YuxK
MLRRFSISATASMAPLNVARHMTTAKNYPPAAIEVYYDGKCSLCKEEIGMLVRWDEGRNRVLFTDLNQLPGDDEMVNKSVGGGFSGGRRGLQERLTGRDVATGEVLSGPATFRRMYSEIGSMPPLPRSGLTQFDTPPQPLFKARIAKWLFRLTSLPGIKQATDVGYALFADRRLRKIEEAASRVGGTGGTPACKDGSCSLYPKTSSDHSSGSSTTPK